MITEAGQSKVARLARLRVTGDGALDHVQPGKTLYPEASLSTGPFAVGSDADSTGFRWNRRAQGDGGQILDATGPRNKAKRRTSGSLRGRDAAEKRRQDRSLLFILEVHREHDHHVGTRPRELQPMGSNRKMVRSPDVAGRNREITELLSETPPRLGVGASASCRDARRPSCPGSAGQAAPCDRLFGVDSRAER